MPAKYCIFFLFCFLFFSVQSQRYIDGTVQDEKGSPIAGASIAIKSSLQGCVSGTDGTFKINLPPIGKQQLLVSFIGYKHRIVDLRISKDTVVKLNIQLEPDNTNIEEIVVKGNVAEQKKREAPIKIEVLNTDKLQVKAVGLPQMINQLSGVKIRQYGGVGSNTVVNINGLQGKEIRFFRDGIPMDYMGNAFSLSLLPVDQVSGIEIYKGVLPVSLCADALGGAINIISKQHDKNNLNVSYCVGSFHTHRATINGYFEIPKTNIFAELSSYYVLSDNNYKIDVEMADEDTGNLKDVTVERFHGGVESKFVEFSTGLKKTKWADVFKVSGSVFSMDKEKQNDIWMTEVFGEVMYYEDSKIFSARYQKSFQKFNIDIFGAYSDLHTLFDDTPEYTYNWLGVATLKDENDNSGESDDDVMSYRKYNWDHWVGRIFMNYDILDHVKIAFTHNYIDKKRVGSDPYAKTYGNDIDVLTIPAKYARNISGLGITADFFGAKLTDVVTLKRYAVNTSSVESSSDYNGTVSRLTDASYGFANSIKYMFSSHRYARISFERATRIPETEEYLGETEDLIVGNPDLKPERSNNLNVGFYTNLNRKKSVWLDWNTFYRYIEDKVVLQSYYLLQSQYDNTDDTKILGSEFALKANLLPCLNFNTAVTYQDIRRTNIQDSRYVLLKNARRPNIPYFFGNAGILYHSDNFIGRGQWQFSANYSFVEKYLLNSIAKSQEPALFGSVDSNANLIPTQQVINVGMTYKLPTSCPVWINLDVNNLLNAKVYDAYRVQKPGINYRLKIKCLIN